VWKSRILLSEAGRKYRTDAQVSVWQQFHGMPRKMLGRCRVVIVTHAPDKRVFDLDNRLKASIDALQHCGVLGNDSQIDDLRILRGEVSKADPRLEVEVEEIRDVA
jgi:crossover junction endodeoxyribonuclease RusA